MMLAGLLVLVGAAALMVRGFDVCGALVGMLGLGLLVLARRVLGVDEVAKGKRP